jgi:cell wall-associated NlpC family hydrolase
MGDRCVRASRLEGLGPMSLTEGIPRACSLRRRTQPFAAVVVAAVLFAVALVTIPAGADQISDKQAEAAAIADKLEQMDARMMDINSQFERANYELHLAQQGVEEARTRAAATSEELDRRRSELREFAITAYQMGNDSPELDALLTSDASTGVQKRTYLENVSGTRQDHIDALNAAKLRAQEDSARLAQAERAADAHASEIEQARSSQQAAVAEQQALASKVQGELSTLVAAETARRAAEQQRAAAAAAAATGGSGGSIPNTPSRIGDNSGLKENPNLPPPPPGQGASGAVAAALTRVGSPYVWGAAGPTTFDCSGLILWAYAQVGINLPHYSGAQYQATTRISASQLQPGDLVFYGPGASEHVAMYIGGNQLVQASHGISVTNFRGWWKEPSGYGRVVS